jgi:hypothetical protein
MAPDSVHPKKDIILAPVPIADVPPASPFTEKPAD